MTPGIRIYQLLQPRWERLKKWWWCTRNDRCMYHTCDPSSSYGRWCSLCMIQWDERVSETRAQREERRTQEARDRGYC